MAFQKYPNLSRRKYPRHQILLIVPLVLIFVTAAVLQVQKKLNMSQSVRFDTVPVDEEGVLRFAAVDSTTGSKISFKDWIHIISDPDSSDAAKTLTNILKVRGLMTPCSRHTALRFKSSPNRL